jgi:tetratricopeptide (TPR) repeat protein
LGKKRLRAAEQEAKIALALEPAMEVTHFALAHVNIAHRKFRQAQEHTQLLLEMDPNHAPYYLLQAHIKLLTRKKGEILPLLEKALKLDPESSEVLAELSKYHADRGALDMAEHYAHESLRHEPESVYGLVAMANVLLRRGRVDEAQDHAVWALRHDPENQTALHVMAGIKARKSPLLGIWWRYNLWMNSIGSTRSVLVLLLAYIVYRLLTMGFEDMGQESLAGLVQYVWIGLVIYTFVGPAMFKRTLEKELSDVELSKDF